MGADFILKLICSLKLNEWSMIFKERSSCLSRIQKIDRKEICKKPSR